MATEKLVDFSV